MSNRKNVYQIDFTAVASGKRIASSKRRVRWRFGFANEEALAAGEKGTACRGEEHDVTLVWSITSGKRVIIADGQEIHFSCNRNNTFEYSWVMRGGHMLKVVAHASPPLSPTPGWRQYDFFVDGQSFFNFPKVYRLGLSPNDPRGANAPTQLAERGQRYSAGADKSSEIASFEAPTNPEEEDAYLQEAIRQSLEQGGGGKISSGGSVISGGGDLLDFDFGDTPAPAAAGSGTYGSGASASASGVFAAPPPGPGAIVQAPAPYGYPYAQQPAPNADPYAHHNAFAAPAPQSTAQSPWGPPPAIATGGFHSHPPQQILTPQGQQTPSSIGFASPPTDFSGFGTPGTTPASPPSAQPTKAPPAQTHLTMNALSGHEGLFDGAPATGSGSLADQAYAKLFNVDTFSLGYPPQPAAGAKRDNPFHNAPLGDMQAKKESAPKKEVMKAPPPTSAMVISGNQNGPWGGQQYNGMMMQQQPPAHGGAMQQPGIMQQQQPMYRGGIMQQPSFAQQQQQQQQPAYGVMQQPAYGQQQQQALPFGGMGMMGQQQPQMGQQPFGQQQHGQQPQMGQQPFGGYGQQPSYQ